MNELTVGKTMTVKEVAEAFECDESTIQKWVKELYPEIVKNGIATRLTQSQVTIIKLRLEKNPNLGRASELPKTDLEKELLIMQAMKFQSEKIENLKKQNLMLENRVSLLIHDKKTYTAGEIAKELNLKSATELNNILEEKEIQYKQNGTWLLHAKYSGNDFESIKQQELDNGKIIYNRHWTGKGRDFILNILKP